MGQQQLLLVILVTILVGIATVVAINVFGTAAEQSNRDAVRQDLLAAAATAQGLWSRPEAMGGTGEDFSNLDDIRRLNIPRGSGVDDVYTAESIANDNGAYSMTTGTTTLTLLGVPNSGGQSIQVILSRDTSTDPDRWQLDWTEI